MKLSPHSLKPVGLARGCRGSTAPRPSKPAPTPSSSSCARNANICVNMRRYLPSMPGAQGASVGGVQLAAGMGLFVEGIELAVRPVFRRRIEALPNGRLLDVLDPRLSPVDL